MVLKAQKDFIIDDAIETAHRRGVPVARSCRLTQTSRSSFYRRIGNPGKRVQEDQKLLDRIRILQEHHQGRYGVRRMTAALRTDGHERKPGHNQVAWLMREYGYSAVIRRANNYRVCIKKDDYRTEPSWKTRWITQASYRLCYRCDLYPCQGRLTVRLPRHGSVHAGNCGL